MAKFKKEKGSKANLVVTIITLVFALIGGACIIIGYKNEFVWWLSTFGIVILVICLPVLIVVLHSIIMKKIGDM